METSVKMVVNEMKFPQSRCWRRTPTNSPGTPESYTCCWEAREEEELLLPWIPGVAATTKPSPARTQARTPSKSCQRTLHLPHQATRSEAVKSDLDSVWTHCMDCTTGAVIFNAFFVVCVSESSAHVLPLTIIQI